MRNYIFILTQLFLSSIVFAQSPSQNYVKTTVYKNSSTQDTVSNVTYIDGLGRPKQQIMGGASASGKDIVTHIGYDDLGRKAKEYLPFAESTSNRKFDTAAESNTTLFYNTADYENTTNPYNETFFEASPLNRVLKQGAPGTPWKGTALLGTADDYIDHTVKQEYDLNNGEDIYNLQVNFSTANGVLDIQSPSLICNGYCSVGVLYKTVTKDENWTASDGNNKTTEEFRDIQGQLILKRTYNDDTNYDTYYVYDNYGNLTYVIPPLGSDIAIKKLIGREGTSYVIREDGMNNLCYQYKYDYRSRLVEKKLPGKGWEYIVYDKLDRAILTQDAELKKLNKWLFTKYDKFNRVIYTGDYVNSSVRKDLQITLDASSSPLSESRGTGSITLATSTLPIYYPNNAFPSTGINVFTINYYDDYNVSAATLPATVYGKILITSTSSVNTKGLPTVSYKRILDNDRWITNINGYDNKGRQIYSYINDDYTKYYSTILTNLDFTGRVIETTTSISKLSLISDGLYSSSAWSPITVIDYYTYDNADRLLKHTQKAGDNTEELIVWNKYNELGQLIEKKVGGMPGADYAGTTGLQTVNMGYNIRGWLKNINDTNTLGADLFAFNIGYNAPTISGATALYNGNISQTTWKTNNDVTTSKRSYIYTYDNLNRLTNAQNYLISKTKTLELISSLNYKESLQYDKNGNITNLDRSGWLVSTAATTTTLDNLTYSYTGNRLDNVTDTGSTESFTDGNIATTSGYNDYSYDDNGNITKDLNKKIGTGNSTANAILYNHLNLPKSITFTNGDKIEYYYDATGIKLRKKVTKAGVLAVTEYNSGFTYTRATVDPNNVAPVFQFFSQQEGYVKRNTDGTYGYVYQYKDHLGNIRLSYGATLQQLWNDTFDTTDDGFGVKSPNTPVTATSVPAQNGALLVNVKAAYDGVNKRIISNATVGQKLYFNLTLDRGTTPIVRVFVTELNTSTGQSAQYLIANVTTAGVQTLNFEYVIKQHPALILSIDKSVDNINTTTTNFKLLTSVVNNVTVNVLEENNYYPFGLKHGGYGNPSSTLNNPSAQKYKYNGKELQDELGLGVYDFGLRQYDPAIGRMLQIDPVTHHNQSPYVAFNNNPVVFVDPDGADAIDPVKESVTMITSTVDKSNVTHINQTTTNTTTNYGEDGSVNVSYSTSSITNTVDAYGNVTNGNTVTTSSGSITKDSEGNVSTTTGKTSSREAKAGDSTSALGEWTSTVSSYNKSNNGVYNVDMINKTADKTTDYTKAGVAVLNGFTAINSLVSKLNQKQKALFGALGVATSAEAIVGKAGAALKNAIGKNNSYAIIYGVQHIQNGALMKAMKTPSGNGVGERKSVGPTSFQDLWQAIKNVFN